MDQNDSNDEEMNSEVSDLASINDEGSFPEEVEYDKQLELDEREEIEISQLRKWVIDCKVPHVYLDKLLHFFRSRLLSNLSKSSKTFFRTSSAKHLITPMLMTALKESLFILV